MAWSLRLSFSSSISDQAIGVAGVISVLLLIGVYTMLRNQATLHWDTTTGVLAIIRAYSIEVYTTRLISSVPQGIDLQHSAKRVLDAMQARYENSGRGVLEFNVCRPLQEGPTLVGFTACRKQYRRVPVGRSLKRLREEVHQDGMILESAMQASYPHTPIERANLESNLMIRSGGTDVFVR